MTQVRRPLLLVCVIGVLAVAWLVRERAPEAPQIRPPIVGTELHFVTQGLQFHVDGPLVQASSEAGIDIRALLERTVDRVQSSLSVPPTTLSIVAADTPDYTSGVTGFTATADGSVVVRVDLDSGNGPRDAIERRLPSTVAHELHHSKRVRQVVATQPVTLADAFVTEGLAVAFEDELFPGVHSWFKSLPGDSERDAWQRALPDLHDVQYDPGFIDVWFRATGDLPRWTGYVIGYHIVKSYEANHPGTSAASLATTDARALVSASGYAP